ncbi:hypothetical protein BJ875DRAFT_520896 [Amylocarpus encephaloides]|uniref:Uncharacterized protein n=1 Tax=Amylocarpus encephaloides TaxID=45428 RepID=A0A9P7YQ24_9HELO|nr:hypothetical protein BJ875DRAFT_520896 [Amylocarpus encephaloides]
MLNTFMDKAFSDSSQMLKEDNRSQEQRGPASKNSADFTKARLKCLANMICEMKFCPVTREELQAKQSAVLPFSSLRTEYGYHHNVLNARFAAEGFQEYIQKPISERVEPDLLELLNVSVEDVEDLTDLLRVYAQIFDQAFFMGILGGAFKLNITSDIGNGIHREVNNGLTECNIWIARPEVDITINLNGCKFYVQCWNDWRTLRQSALATLVHEMLHAFFDIYDCRCITCKSNDPAPKGGLGFDGHGPVFADCLVVLIPEVSRMLNLEPWRVEHLLDLSYGIKDNMAHESWIPTKAQLERWGMSDLNYDDTPEMPRLTPP